MASRQFAGWTTRYLTTSRVVWAPTSHQFSKPSPPPLRPQDQREFEKLVQRAQAPLSSQSSSSEEVDAMVHPDARPKVKPAFEGEVNPVTGEVGGPKQDPLSSSQEWTYGGRVGRSTLLFNSDGDAKQL